MTMCQLLYVVFAVRVALQYMCAKRAHYAVATHFSSVQGAVTIR